jgi:hypothetical protein
MLVRARVSWDAPRLIHTFLFVPLSGFHARLSKHSTAFLKAVDADMQRKEVRRSGEPTTQLGVVVFAFEDPLMTGETARHGTPVSRNGLRRGMPEKVLR